MKMRMMTTMTMKNKLCGKSCVEGKEFDYCKHEDHSLDCMFYRQIQYQKKSNGNTFPEVNPDYVATFSLGLIAELGEVLQVYKGWKPWKKEDIEVDRKQMDPELADMWHFMINLSLALGYDAEDVVRAFNEKHLEVMDRLEE